LAKYALFRNVIHLATHAQFEIDDPHRSFIQLWDTQLNMNQLYTLGWHEPPQVELLVLSACQTALGNREAELGFAGLAVNSGVKSALASLWNVSDESTALLMTVFYDALRNQPIKAEALQEAQLALLRGEVTVADLTARGLGIEPIVNLASDEAPAAGRGFGDLTHPFYWAAFTLIGSPW